LFGHGVNLTHKEIVVPAEKQHAEAGLGGGFLRLESGPDKPVVDALRVLDCEIYSILCYLNSDKNHVKCINKSSFKQERE